MATLQLAVACSADTLWGHRPAELRSALAAGNHAILTSIDLEQQPARHARLLGQDAPLFLALITERRGDADSSRRLLREQFARGPRWARERAGLFLVQALVRAEDYRSAIAIARTFARRFPDSPLLDQVRRSELEAWYWQRNDRRVLEQLAGAERLDADPELLLIEAVAAARLAQPGWPERFVRLATSAPAAAVHQRAYGFLAYNPLGTAEPDLLALLEAKSHLAGGNNLDGGPLLERYLRRRPHQATPLLVRELAAALRSAGDDQHAATVMAALAEAVPEAARWRAQEEQARAARDAGDHQQALAVLEQLIARQPAPQLADRYRWLRLDILLRRAPHLSPLAGHELLREQIGSWQQMWFFEDLLEDQLSELVANANWPAVAQVLAAMQAREAPPPVAAGYAYLLAVAIRHGLAPPQLGGGEQQLLEQAVGYDPQGYYGTLARLVLGRGPALIEQLLSSGAAAGQGDAAVAARQAGVGSDHDRFVNGLFRYGLFERGLQLVNSRWSSTATWVLRDAAMALGAAGRHLDSIRVASRLLRTRADQLAAADPFLAYPRFYAGEIDALSLAPLAPEVFYALVREESHFDAAIVSHAGAVGLTQLMPATAEDEARRMRLEQPLQLADPLQNLAIGAHHLLRLRARLDGDVTRSLMAYNAGLSRVRAWDRRFAGLPVELYAAVVPFVETRNYVRKIVLSAVWYGYLYEQRAPADTVGLFFPAFAGSGAAPESDAGASAGAAPTP